MNQDVVDLLQSQQELRFQFVVTELARAATFSDIAVNTRKDARFLHNFKLG